jgi:hypothetical protein
MTWPLRKLRQLITKTLLKVIALFHSLVQLPERTVKMVLLKVMSFSIKHPVLKKRALAYLQKHPGLEARMRRFALTHNLLAVQPVSVKEGAITNTNKKDTITSVTELADLSPSARHIYEELKVIMKERQRGME